jgi:hypothetical protein
MEEIVISVRGDILNRQDHRTKGELHEKVESL